MASPTTTAFALTSDNVDLITSGYKWVLDSSRTVDYSISNGFFGEYWVSPSLVAQYVGAALNIFSQYADIKFNYVGNYSTPTTAAAAGSEINVSLDGYWRFFNSTSQWAVGNFPNNSNPYQLYSGQAGDIYLNINSQANTLIVVDCLTLWLNNLLFSEHHAYPDTGLITPPEAWTTEIDALLTALLDGLSPAERTTLAEATLILDRLAGP